MSLPAVLLMAFTGAFVLLLLSEYIAGRRHPLPVPDGAEESAAASPSRRDALLAWGLAALYAVVAFTNLGDTVAPALAYTPAPGDSAVIELPFGTELDHVLYFAGTRTGTWQLEISADGTDYIPYADAEQDYVAVLKWNTASAGCPMPARFLRVTSIGSPDMGELALFTMTGQRIAPLSVSPNGAVLFDEPDLVPDGQTYLNSSIFDEIYHVRTAREGLLGDTMYEITHPPLGKQILSLGMLLFGVNPFGWRFMGTLAGVLMLPALYDFLFRLTRRRRLAVCGTLVFAFDFMHFTQTRLATIDSYSVLFTLLAYLYMFRFYMDDDEKPLRSLGLCGMFFGLGAATKWTGLYAGAGLAVLWLLYWLQSGRFLKKEFWKNVLWCLLFFVAVPALIYYLSYWPYGRAAGMRFPGMWFSRDYLRIVLDNQRYMFSYHSNLVATHPYASRWWQWLLDVRPILYYLSYAEDGCKSCIAAFTNPVLCWGGLAALFATFTWPRFRRSRKVQFLWVGYLAALVPWMGVSRLTFAYHYFTAELFLLGALALFWERLEDLRGEHWHAPATAALAGVLFVLFYPALSGLPVNAAFFAKILHWLPSWPI